MLDEQPSPPNPSRVQPGLGTVGQIFFVIAWLLIFAVIIWGAWTT